MFGWDSSAGLAARKVIKRIRDFPPINLPATSIVRSVVREPRPWLVRYLPRTGIVEAPLPDGTALKLWSLADDWVASPVYWRGWDGYEGETSRPFYERASRARVVLDIGAHVGYFSVLAALANRRSRVFAFEPNPVVFGRLLRNIDVNGLVNVVAVPKAVGCASGTAEFYSVPDGVPANSSLSLEYISTCEVVESSSVPMVSIDDFVETEGLEIVDLVKIDTETTEADVLEGMAATLERFRPSVFCELLSPEAERRVHDRFAALDYQRRVVAADGRNHLFEPRGR